ncbi:unnamed protein product [Symbiodinium pilosum]|uniref:Uncharacterized protein n=1 Tax=Symbiodinium pilosum TaxID=2952 RepID=A0A812VTZ4_SYMPI|nr:unnamed protein product [Symbiodinium pilosum]
MPTPSPLLPTPSAKSQLQDRLQLTKELFDENVERLRAEFERALAQAHLCVTFIDNAQSAATEEEEILPPASSPEIVDRKMDADLSPAVAC